jgi:hypothetical protein
VLDSFDELIVPFPAMITESPRHCYAEHTTCFGVDDGLVRVFLAQSRDFFGVESGLVF